MKEAQFARRPIRLPEAEVHRGADHFLPRLRGACRSVADVLSRHLNCFFCPVEYYQKKRMPILNELLTAG